MRNGVERVRQALADLRAQVARGEKPRVVFGLDATLADTRAVPFKSDPLKGSEAAGRHVSFFVTESRRDIAGLQRAGTCSCLLLESGVSGTDGVRPGTPVWPRVDGGR